MKTILDFVLSERSCGDAAAKRWGRVLERCTAPGGRCGYDVVDDTRHVGGSPPRIIRR